MPLLDDFNRADGAPGSNWTLTAGSYTIVSNRLVRQPATGGDSIRWTGTAMSSADHYVEAKIYGYASHYALIRARVSSDGQTFYAGYWHLGGFFAIGYQTSGTWGGEIATTGGTLPSDGTVLRLEVEGTAIRLYSGGVLRVSTTHSTITTGTAIGFQVSGAAQFDDFGAGALGAGGITGTGAIVEADDLTTGVGDYAPIPITGTATIGEADDLTTGVGDYAPIPITGTATLGEADDTAAAVGTYLPAAITGTATIGEADDTITGVGDWTASAGSFSGTAALLEADDTVTATGNSTIPATYSLYLGASQIEAVYLGTIAINPADIFTG